MVFIPAPQGVEVVLKMTQNSVPIVNVWNVDVGHAVTHADLTGVFAVFDAWITSDYCNMIHNSVTFDQLVLTDISVANGEQIQEVPTTTAGALTGTAAAANASLVASLRTAKTGRSYRGRTYIPGLITSMFTDAQHINAGITVQANDVFVDLINALTTGGYKLVVLSRYLNKALRVVAVLTEVISIITDTKVDSQRRRTAN